MFCDVVKKGRLHPDKFSWGLPRAMAVVVAIGHVAVLGSNVSFSVWNQNMKLNKK